MVDCLGSGYERLTLSFADWVVGEKHKMSLSVLRVKGVFYCNELLRVMVKQMIMTMRVLKSR